MQTDVPAAESFELEALISDLSIGVVTLGADGGVQYANRAALAMHGVGSLDGLGRTAAAYREHFVLEDLLGVPLVPSAYPFERLLAGETFAELNVRVPVGGDLQVHRCRGVRVQNQAGDTAFYALFLDDETERYDAEERFERTFAANPAPALINRLSDLRFIKVNQGFLEMTGFRREEVIGRTAYEFDVLAGVQHRESVVRRFHEGRPILPTESFLDTRAGGKKFVLVGGQPLEVGNEPCMLLTFIDLDERKRAEDALAQSEERFSKAFAAAPTASVISSLHEGRIFNVNEAFSKLTGYGAGEAVGRTGLELRLWGHDTHRVIADLLRSNYGYRDLELKLCAKSGELRDVSVSAVTVKINGEDCILCMFHDVTLWKRTETELTQAVNLVMKDPEWFSNSFVKNLMALRGQGPSPEVAAKLRGLTPRERQVLDLICRGFDSPGVAAELRVSHNTVRNYVAGLYKKLEVHSRAEVMVWAKRHGVIGG